MPTACCLFRSTLAERRDAYAGGLARLGYTVEERPSPNPRPGDVLLLWNRFGTEGQHAKRYEAAGARVIVSENGYISPPGQKLYALALGHHNGAGEWREGDPGRWDSFGIELAPWRSAGEQVVVLPQRGIGESGVAMPREWTGKTLRYLRTHRPIKLRRHPGATKDEPYDALRNAHCAITWGSGAAIKALVAGVPVFHTFPQWIGAPASTFGVRDLEKPWTGDRMPMLRRLAWAQFRLREIETGEAFEWLLNA